MLPSLMHSSMWTVYGLNVANNKLKVPAVTLLCTGVCNVLLTLLLVKTTALGVYAILGVSVALNFLYYCIYIPYYAAREMGVSPRSFYLHIGKTAVYTVLVLVVFPPVLAKLPTDRWLTFFACAVVAEAAGVLLYAWIVLFPRDRAALVSQIAGKRAK